MATFCLSEVWFWVEYDNVVLYRLPILRLSFTYRLTLKGTLKLVDTKPCCCWYDSLCDISCTYIGLIPNPYPLVETMCISSPWRWRLLDALTGHALVLHSWALNSQCTFNSTKSSGESSPRIDMSPHSDILSWFWANQYLFFLFNAACLAEEQQIPNLIVIGSNPRSTALETSTLTICITLQTWLTFFELHAYVRECYHYLSYT
jgi:hypothetical protein